MTESRPPLPPFTLETKKGHVTCYRKPGGTCPGGA